jgi:hypothetical protein
MDSLALGGDILEAIYMRTFGAEEKRKHRQQVTVE